MSVRCVLACLLIATGLTACSGRAPAAKPPAPPATPTAVPSYDVGLPPARAVLALVPEAATTLELTDDATIRRDVGLPELTRASSAADRAAFGKRAAADTALLARGLLRPVDQRLRTSYGFGQDDIAWEAHFSGGVHGWVVSFEDRVDMRSVRRAARRGVGALARADVDVADHLATRGVPNTSGVWADDDGWTALLPSPGEAFVLRRGCVPTSRLVGPSHRAEGVLVAVPTGVLQPLDASALTLGDHVVTVRMSRDRVDLFDRLDLARRWPLPGRRRVGDVLRHGVGDPSGGRMGFDVPRPARAVALLRERLLPYAVCPPPA